MKFTYIGEAPNGEIEQYGNVFRPNEPVDVTDEAAIEKLKAHKFFEAVNDSDAPATKNKGGRPKKIVTEQPESENDGDANGN